MKYIFFLPNLQLGLFAVCRHCLCLKDLKK